MAFDLERLLGTLNVREENQKKDRISALEDMDEPMKKEMLRLCRMKKEEFSDMGYDKMTEEEIYTYIKSRFTESMPPLHRIVGEILSLRPNDVMNWLTVNAYRGRRTS